MKQIRKRTQHLTHVQHLRWFLPALLLGFCFLLPNSQASAVPLSFSVQPASNLTLSGTYNDGSSTFPLQEQSAGSLLTTGTGSFLVDITSGVSQLQFLSGESVSANAANGGANYQPNSLPANWAFQAITAGPGNGLLGAVRNATEEMTSLVKPLNSTGPASWDFDSTGIGVTMTDGTLFTQALFGGSPFGGVVPFAIAGENGTNTPGSPTGTLLESSGIYTLTVPVDVTFVKTESGQTFTLNLAGSVIATATAPIENFAVPEPSSLALLSFGLLLHIRRRKSR